MKEVFLSVTAQYLSSESFATKVVAMDSTARHKTQAIYRGFFGGLVLLLSHSIVEKEHYENVTILSVLNSAMAMIHKCMEHLSHLLSVKSFVEALSQLITLPNPQVRLVHRRRRCCCMCSVIA